MTYENATIVHEDALAIVSVCRPDTLNALNDATLDELLQIVADSVRAATTS